MHMSNHDARTMPLKDVPSICICTCTYALCRKYKGERCIQEGARGVSDVAFGCGLGPRVLGIDMHGGFVMYLISRLA